MRHALILGCLLVMLCGCNLGETEPTPGPTPDLPQIAFNAPPNGSQVFEGVLMDVDLVARDSTQGVVKIEFYVDGELLSEGESDTGAEPLFRVTMNWLAEGVGLHSLSAISYRPDGTRSEEVTIVIEVISRT